MAQRKHGDRLTPLETEIINALWEISPTTAQTVRQRLERELAYTRRRLCST
jgi:predicted transcriptional regulator